jgi:hypothetical protein
MTKEGAADGLRDSRQQVTRKARKLGHHRTKKETVVAALDEYIKRRQQQGILSLFGKIEYHTGYDYRNERKKENSRDGLLQS